MMITQKELKELFTYNPEDGRFYRKTNNKRSNFLNWKGYILVSIKGKPYRAHRMAWLYMYGDLPKGQLDHINGIKTDNRIANLRQCTNAENHCNRGKNENNTSGYKGVGWSKERHKWYAKIMKYGISKHLGYYEDKKNAAVAYNQASIFLNGEFAYVNRVAVNDRI